MTDCWRYYNHALLPNSAPHKEFSKPNNTKEFWKCCGGTPILARWTTDFDCGYETDWWFVIKDQPFDISAINSNYRYKIKKGSKLFEVKKISPMEYVDELYEVQRAAYSSWPEKYRPSVDKELFTNSVREWESLETVVIYAAFFRETQKLCGYILANTYEDWSELTSQRVDPTFEKYQINAALIYGYLLDMEERLKGDFYICDGARSIRHETAFQDYLEKYFGFRKAYCKLKIMYRFPVGIAIAMLKPFKKIINNNTSIGSILLALVTMDGYKDK